MPELFYIFRHDTQQYLHGLTSTGYMLWVDQQEQGQLFREDEADRIKDMWNENPYKNSIEIIRS